MQKLTFNKKAPARSQATIAKLANRVDYWLELATRTEHEQGLNWYKEAGEFCSAVASECGFTLSQVAQCVAILSSQIDWDQNKRNAALLASSLDPSIKIFASQKQKQKALQALFGDYVLPASARKTYSFAQNIADPASLRVTVDRHAIQAALNSRDTFEGGITDKRYREVEAAYQEVAKKHGLFPYQVQAIVWVTYKRVVNR